MYFRPVLFLILVLYVLLNDSDHHFIAFVNGGNAPSTQYYSMGDANINCGSVGNSTALDGREWIGDASSKFLSGKSRTSAAAEKSFSIDPVPYKTSRISSTEFSYAFEVNPGQKFIRLHFYPASYRGFENSVDFFAVKAGPFTLLRDFSATLIAESTGLKYLVKEFCLNVEENRRLSITFLPSPITKSKLNIHAFVNGIEIISMPTGLYYTHDGDLGARVVGQKDGFYNIDNSTALEVTHRLNVGGSSISSVEDFGMFRRWSEDTNYLLQSGVDRVNHQALGIKYARMPEFIAPPKLYQMSWKAGGNVRVNRMYNITWKIPLELSFVYLVRLHFCQLDDGMAERKKREFSVLINNHIVETQADVIRWSGGNGIPVYRDYLVKMKGDKEGSKCDLLIALQSADKLVFGLLNGLEIFKLSNLGNSLATPNPTFPKRVSTSWNWTIQKLFLTFGQSNVIVTGMTIFIVLVNAAVYSLRQIWEDKFNLETDKQTSRMERSYHRFTLVEIKSATQNFSDAFVIGRGGFGKVYKGYIPSISEIVAIKRLNFYSKQGPHEFWTEIDTLSKLRHVHLVSLLGYCNEGQEMILVYEYMPCGTLADNLYKLSRKGKDIDPLGWEQRLRICIGAARGLEYLHTGTECAVIHRDVKDSNILLDENFVAKISDFGLSKIEKITQSKSYVSTKVRGTYGYLDPEYVMTHRLTRKTDVYAFGVVLLVVLSGRPAIDTKSQEHQSLLSCFRECITEGDFDRIVDPYLQGKILSKSLTEFLKSVENCLHHLPKKRPTMAQVVASLEQALEQQESPMVSSSTNSAVNDREEVPILGENVVPLPEEGITSNPTQNPSSPTRGNDLPVIEENVIPSPEEGNTSSLTQNPYSPTRGNDLQPRRKDYARVPKPSRNWPWKAIWNKVFPTTFTAREAGAGAVGGTAGAEPSSSKDEVTGASTREERNKLVFFDGGGYSFGLDDVLRASAEVLGKGSVGTSYRVVMEEGTTVVVKRLKFVVVSKKEFEQQMEVLGKIKHENVMPLRAYYYSKDEQLLFSDYLPAGSLSTLLHGSRGCGRTPLYWDTRKRIALAAARGLAHLHVAGKVVDGNIKSSNILLRQDHQDACVSDYGLNPLFTNLSPSNQRVAGYHAPEVLETRKVTFKSDVYSFGVLLLELVTGKAPNQASLVEGGIDLPRWIQSVIREEWTAEVIDLELLRYHHVEEEMVQLLQIGMSCVAVPDQRPAMQEVVRMIEDINRGETDDGLRQSSDDPSKGSDGHTPPQESRSSSRGVTP